jgi:LytR cell envelope-related transcriptional attenuator
MHALKTIGPVLGIASFVGLSVLAFLLFQQARDIRRLREWAGRAPERAREAADAVQAAADASRGDGEAAASATDEEAPGPIAARWRRLKGAVGPRLAELDRRLPVDGRYLLVALLVAVAAVGVVTSGFGLVGGGGATTSDKRGADKPKVAVLNGTSVPNLASQVDKDVVKRAGYKSSEVTNSPSSFATTVVMYASGRRSDAKAFADAIKSKLGHTPTQPMTTDVRSRARGAALALALGLDDSGFAGG